MERQKQVYIYQVADNEECMKKLGLPGSGGADRLQRGHRHGICWSTASGKASGVLGPEAFDPIPFMEKMADYGFPYGIKEM